MDNLKGYCIMLCDSENQPHQYVGQPLKLYKVLCEDIFGLPATRQAIKEAVAITLLGIRDSGEYQPTVTPKEFVKTVEELMNIEKGSLTLPPVRKIVEDMYTAGQVRYFMFSSDKKDVSEEWTFRYISPDIHKWAQQ